MNISTILQTSPEVMAKSAEMAEKDPHGAIITLVSVSVVFVALIVLYFSYSLIGRLSNGGFDIKKAFSCRKDKTSDSGKGVPTEEEAAAIALALDQELNGETYAAIAMALHQYMNETVHDMESYIITIKRK
jgi:Na+-transporting methylmalonyl-CoA/oxaloacetate decarboxylase gamma subunit